MDELTRGSVPHVMSTPIIIKTIVISFNIPHASPSPSTPGIMRPYGLIILLKQSQNDKINGEQAINLRCMMNLEHLCTW